MTYWLYSTGKMNSVPFIALTVDQKAQISRLEGGTFVRKPSEDHNVHKGAIFPQQNCAVTVAGNYNVPVDALQYFTAFLGNISSAQLVDGAVHEVNGLMMMLEKKGEPVSDFHSKLGFGLFQPNGDGGREPRLFFATIPGRQGPTVKFGPSAKPYYHGGVDHVPVHTSALIRNYNTEAPLEAALAASVADMEEAAADYPNSISNEFETFLLRANRMPARVELEQENGIVKIKSETPIEHPLVFDDTQSEPLFGDN